MAQGLHQPCVYPKKSTKFSVADHLCTGYHKLRVHFLPKTLKKTGILYVEPLSHHHPSTISSFIGPRQHHSSHEEVAHSMVGVGLWSIRGICLASPLGSLNARDRPLLLLALGNISFWSDSTSQEIRHPTSHFEK